MLDGRSAEDLQAEYGKQQQEVIGLEKAAAALAKYNIDTYAIRQDIERLEGEMSGGVTADFSGSGRERSGDFGFAAPLPAEGPAGFLAELGIASRIGGIEMETLIPAVEAAAQRNLSAHGRKYVGSRRGMKAIPLCMERFSDQYSELSHGTRT
jgi:hypothetical protein